MGAIEEAYPNQSHQMKSLVDSLMRAFNSVVTENNKARDILIDGIGPDPDQLGEGFSIPHKDTSLALLARQARSHINSGRLYRKNLEEEIKKYRKLDEDS